MNLLQIVESIAFLGLCYAAVILIKHWASIQQVTIRQLDLPVLNLQGGGFAEAEKSYFENLPVLLRDGYQKYKHGFYQLFSPTGYLVIASADYIQEMNQLPKGTLDFHSASQKVRRNRNPSFPSRHVDQRRQLTLHAEANGWRLYLA
jgi:hypothetical protein